MKISSSISSTSTIYNRGPMNVLAGMNILIGATGSVASVRIPLLLRTLQSHGARVRLVMTSNASHFISREDVIPDEVETFTDADEWSTWTKLTDPILHIELRKWADLFLIAPTSANVMAKLANGLCDDLLTCIARAWPLKPTTNYKQNGEEGDEQKPLIIAPAMNTMMWTHPVTRIQLDILNGFGIHIIMPISKRLACGDVGVGAMEVVPNIVDRVINILSQSKMDEATAKNETITTANS